MLPEARVLRAWLDAAGIAAGPVFRPVRKCGAQAGIALSVETAHTVLKNLPPLAKLDYVPI